MTRALQLICIGAIGASSLLAQEPILRTTLVGHSEEVCSIAWSPDGKGLASGSVDGTIRLWDAVDGKVIASLSALPIDFESTVSASVAWSPDGTTLASGYGKTVRLWAVSSRKNVATLKGHSEQIDTVVWSPDGKTLTSVGGGAIKNWEVSTGTNSATLEPDQEWFSSVAWSPDGKFLAAGNADGAVKVYTLTISNTVASLDGVSGEPVLAVSYSPDGTILASGDGCMIQLRDAASHKTIRILKGHSCDLVTYAHGQFGGQSIPLIKSLAFSADGKTLASGSQDKTIILWDVASGKRICTLTGHSDDVESVAFSPDGKALASASDDQTIRIWNIAIRPVHK